MPLTTLISKPPTQLASFTAHEITLEAAIELRNLHQARAEQLTAPYRQRKVKGQKHEIEDFLYTYYPYTPAQLRRWHPGWWNGYDLAADTFLAGSADITKSGSRRWYLDTKGNGVKNRIRRADFEAFVASRKSIIEWIYRLLENSSLDTKAGNFSCFGMHEWAMVYQSTTLRHQKLPLRLSVAETNEVVEQHKLVCSHIDAFRFFTEPAAKLNALTPTRESQDRNDNPACLHVGMDLYKWAVKLLPLIPSSLALDCFEHALKLRILDMQASPYDCTSLGYEAIEIETKAGKAEYVRKQKQLASQSQVLRNEILKILEPLLANTRN